MPFETVICDEVDELPTWLRGHALDVALQAFDEDDDATVVVARRRDGEVQVVPAGHLDADVIASLLKWASE